MAGISTRAMVAAIGAIGIILFLVLNTPISRWLLIRRLYATKRTINLEAALERAASGSGIIVESRMNLWTWWFFERSVLDALRDGDGEWLHMNCGITPTGDLATTDITFGPLDDDVLISSALEEYGLVVHPLNKEGIARLSQVENRFIDDGVSFAD